MGYTITSLWGIEKAFNVVNSLIWFLPCLLAIACFWGCFMGGILSGFQALFKRRHKAVQWEYGFPTFALGFSLCWLLFDVARGSWLIPFPWNLTTHLFAFENLSPALACLQVVKPFGVFFLSAAWALVLSAWFLSRSVTLRATTTLLWGGILGYGAYQLGTPPNRLEHPLQVLVVQPNVPQQRKIGRTYAEPLLDDLLDQTLEALKGLPQDPDLIVWPETSVLHFISKEIPPKISEKLLLSHSILAFGADRLVSTDSPNEICWYNSLFFLNDDVCAVYDKVKLLPFGEYIPLRKHFPAFLEKRLDGVDCTPGSPQEELKIAHLPPFRPVICSEGIFSRRGQTSAWTLQVLNDAWFQNSILWQHLAVDRVRTIESGRPLIRVGNTGVTALLDARGRIRQSLPSHKKESGVFELY